MSAPGPAENPPSACALSAVRTGWRLAGLVCWGRTSHAWPIEASRGGGADDLDDGVVPSRWITVVIYPDELGWLREALQLRAVGDGEDELELL